jgi:hypothetical protein
MHPTCTPRFCTCIVALLLLFGSAFDNSLHAQSLDNSSSLAAFDAAKAARRSSILDATPDYFRHVEKLPSFYTGFAIELVLTEEPITKENQLFQQFGHVYYDKPQAGQYAYLILTNFVHRNNAEKFLEMVVKNKAPNARILEYKSGLLRK